MGQLRDKKIVQSRSWLTPNQEPLPSYDYDYTYPISVYEAIKRDMTDTSTNLLEELDSIYRLLADKQDSVDPGKTGSVMTWSGIKGKIGSTDVVKNIPEKASERSYQRLVSEKAIGDALDLKVPLSAFNQHINNNSIHITDTERVRWNSAAPLSTLEAHIGNHNVHVTENEKTAWNNKANQEDFEEHIYDINNPHNVTAHQVGAYTYREIDDMFESLRESFFHYQNIFWDERNNIARLVEYHPSNWNPNYVLAYGDPLPNVEDPTLTYFALKPTTDYQTNETQDCSIWIKRPGLAWYEIGLSTMNIGDMVISYPDTKMCVWTQGRFMNLFNTCVCSSDDYDDDNGSGSGTGGGTSSGGTSSSTNKRFWRPEVDEDGYLRWKMSSSTEEPEGVLIIGKDGYTPIKGIDYVDGKDGVGVPVGGRPLDILVKLTEDNYDTTWKSFMDLLSDLVTAGSKLPQGLVDWNDIINKPEIYNELGNHENGLIDQKTITREFELVNNSINNIIQKIDGANGFGDMKDTLDDHLKDYNNPHRVTTAMIGAVPNATFLDHTGNQNNPHNVTAKQIGLGNVNNTADMDKPISTATQEALDEINKALNDVTKDVKNFDFVTNVAYNKSGATITFTFRTGKELDIYIPISETFNSIYFDQKTKELVIILPDGNENRINISSLIKAYTGGTSANIQVNVEDNDIITATIIPGTVGELEISPSVKLRGSPVTTTQPVTDKSTRIATTEYVRNQVIDNLISYEKDRPLSANMGRILNQTKADVDDILDILNSIETIDVIDNLDSTSAVAALSANMGRHLDLTKAPRVHTSSSGSTYGVATVSLFGHTRATDIEPLMSGTVFKGTDNGEYARGDHRHPTDTSRAPVHWPDVANKINKMTGEPKAETPPDDSNDERIATTEWIRRNAVGVSIGNSDTSGDALNKIVTLKSDFGDAVFMRQTGSTVVVVFNNTDTSDKSSGNLTMNVHKTGAAPVVFAGSPVATGMLKGGYSYIFTFDGTNWRLHNPSGLPLPADSENSNAIATTEWVRRNAIGVSFGTCSTGSTSTKKVAKLESSLMSDPVFNRVKGSTVTIKFDNENTATGTVTLDVQNSGESEIRFGGNPILPKMILDGHSYIFTWDGTYWQLLNPSAFDKPLDGADNNQPATTAWTRENIMGNFYGICNTNSNIATKVVTLTSPTSGATGFKRKVGVSVTVLFTNDDTSGTGNTTMLNVDSTGAAPIKYHNADLSNNMICANQAHQFIWDGSAWQLINPTNPWIWGIEGIVIGPGNPTS